MKKDFPLMLQITGIDENRPVGFPTTGNIPSACNLFDGPPVGPEDRHIVRAIPAEMVVECASTDFAAHTGFSILPPEHDPVASLLLVMNDKARSGRSYLGVELEAKYCQSCFLQRIARTAATSPVFDQDAVFDQAENIAVCCVLRAFGQLCPF